MALKLLVCGDVGGKFDELFKRVAAVNKKNGPFEMLLCVGDFFGSNRNEWEEYATTPSKIPIHTYILGPNKSDYIEYYPESKGSEICDRVTYLGKTGLFTGGSGLQIAYVSGTEDRKDQSSRTSFTNKEIDELQLSVVSKSKFIGVDILLSSQWPKDVTKYAATPDGIDPSETGSLLLSQLAVVLKPRYHFCAIADIHYERVPYRNHRVLAESVKHITRFIALAKVGNSAKKKWLYAFSITPINMMDHGDLVKQPEDVTECPFQLELATKKQNNLEKNVPQQFFYDLSPQQQQKHDKLGQRRCRKGQGNYEVPSKKPKTQLPPLSSCWFCLSSPQVEKHLIISIGDHNYLALAKGGLVPDHVLILPIGHCQATTSLDDDALAEIDLFKSALQKFFRSQGKTVVFFERNFKSHHLQIQVVPLPLSRLDTIKQTFFDTADSQSINLDEIPYHSDLKQICKPGAPYFYVELENKGKLLHRIKKHFPLQFGREVLASPPLLNLPEKVEWRDCSSSKEEETHLATEFRKAFQPFDFTL